MDYLPRGANFQRSKTLWEIALSIAGDPNEPYTGNRDMCLVVGSGSGASFTPWLRMSTGSPVLAHAVAKGEIDMAFVNPSGALTQAYRGKGLFDKPLPLRVVCSYPSWDRFVVVAHERTGIRSLGDLKDHRGSLRISVREDPTHSTRVLTNQILGLYGFSLEYLESRGAAFQGVGPPSDERRIASLQAGEIDLCMDEGIPTGWFEAGLENGMRPITIEDELFDRLQDIGWRRVVIPAGGFRGLKEDYGCIDYSGWPLYTRESLPDEKAYRVCAALHARSEFVPWERSYAGIGQTGQDTDATPIDVPLHAGAARWYREHGFIQ